MASRVAGEEDRPVVRQEPDLRTISKNRATLASASSAAADSPDASVASQPVSRRKA
jgi:hypothetical protein